MIELENSIIGAVLKSNELIYELDVTPEMFTQQIAKNAWDLITAEITLGNSINAVSLMGNETLFDYAVECSNNHFSNELAKSHAKKLREVAIQRNVKDIGYRLQQSPENYEDLIRELLALETKKTDYNCHIKASLKSAIEHIDKLAKGQVDSISTGLEKLDEVIGGYHKGDFIVIAARPAM